jgi:hypothetical protein
MQDQSFYATPIEPSVLANRLVAEAAASNWAEVTNLADTLRAPYDYEVKVPARDVQQFYCDPMEACLTVDPRYRGWQLVTVWTGVIVGSWSLVVGCALIAHALFA